MVTRLERNSNPWHRLTRFVTKKAAAIMFDLMVEDIYLVARWANIVYIHGKSISRFVSYADFPPTVAVATPSDQDFAFWSRRWSRSKQIEQKKQAPAFWVKFFAYQFHQAHSVEVLFSWGKLMRVIKFAFGETSLQELRANYLHEKMLLSFSNSAASSLANS